MDYRTIDFDVNQDPEGFVIDLDSLYAHLATLTDRRHPRGKRYSLVTIFLFIVLAKLAGEDRLFGIAQWARLRCETLAEALQLRQVRAPCLNTYRRVLGEVVDIEELERVVREFFATRPRAGQSVVIALDGKTLRGTISAGQTHGRHLLAAYLPAEGWVLFQVEVGAQENEHGAALRLLKCLDLRGKIVTGDAMFAQRELSRQIVAAGGAYVWTVKENQPQVRQDIELLFQPEQTVKGFSQGTHDFRTAQTENKGHGRQEVRRLTVSAELKPYLDWPGAEQVFRVERFVKRSKDGHAMHEVEYGITSLSAAEAGPQRVLELIRGHWSIENGLHYRRDETLREDWCQLKHGQAPRAMAVINNLIVGLVARLGWTNLAEARRHFDAHPEEVVKLVLRGEI
jgi:predicted transposase YbfD/YdcC